MKSFKIILLFILWLGISQFSFAYERIFYTLRYQSSDRMSSPDDMMARLKAHYKKIDLLIPQAYYTSKQGIITGAGVEPDVLSFANAHGIKVMPLVTNYQFDADLVHQFLADSALQTKAIADLVKLCQEKHFVGVQLDFEMIPLKDRDALTHFFQAAAKAMHENGFKISFAVAPVATDQPESTFLKRLYTIWEGAYDLKALAEAGDFISVMAYNQHSAGTTPGGTANWPWVEQVVKYTLKQVPRQKLSLGLPSYSTYWYTGTDSNSPKSRLHVKMDALSYEEAARLAKKFGGTLHWDNEANIYYTLYSRHWLNEYIFLEDERSFKAKLSLVEKYKLRGISVFDLGTEDDNTWKELKSSR